MRHLAPWNRHTSLVATQLEPSACGPGTSTHEAPNLVVLKHTELDFEGVDVTGALVKPHGTLLLSRRKAPMNPLIEVRDSFDEEIRASASSVAASSSDLDVHASVHDALDERSAQLRFCADKAAEEWGPARGRLDLAWTLQDGRVEALVVVRDTVRNPVLTQCVLERVARWRFEDGSGEIWWPLVFR